MRGRSNIQSIRHLDQASNIWGVLLHTQKLVLWKKKKKKDRLASFANFCGVNISPTASFKVPTVYINGGVGEKTLKFDSRALTVALQHSPSST